MAVSPVLSPENPLGVGLTATSNFNRDRDYAQVLHIFPGICLSLTPGFGTFLGNDSTLRSVFLYGACSSPPQATIDVVGGPSFTMYGFSSESGFMAGTTPSGGEVFGAHANRQ